MSTSAISSVANSVRRSGNLRRAMITSINWDRIPRTSSKALIHLFQRGTHTHVMVDGLNFGKRLWEWLYPSLDLRNLSHADFKRLRDDIVALVTWLCYQTQHCTASIIFDSTACYTKTINDRVEVAFSGGTGPNRADTIILHSLERNEYRSQFDDIVLVTDDQELGYEAMNLGARLLGADEFCSLLSRKVA